MALRIEKSIVISRKRVKISPRVQPASRCQPCYLDHKRGCSSAVDVILCRGYVREARHVYNRALRSDCYQAAIIRMSDFLNFVKSHANDFIYCKMHYLRSSFIYINIYIFYIYYIYFYMLYIYFFVESIFILFIYFSFVCC